MTRTKGSPNAPQSLLSHNSKSKSTFNGRELVLPKLESISQGNNEVFGLILISYAFLGKVST